MSEYGKNMATTEQLKAIFVLKKVLAFLWKNPLDLVSCWYRPNDNSGDWLMNMEFGSILKIPENSLGCVVCVYD
jgi:hypothetical protein